MSLSVRWTRKVYSPQPHPPSQHGLCDSPFPARNPLTYLFTRLSFALALNRSCLRGLLVPRVAPQPVSSEVLPRARVGKQPVAHLGFAEGDKNFCRGELGCRFRRLPAGHGFNYGICPLQWAF